MISLARTIFRGACALAGLASVLFVGTVFGASDLSGEWEFSANYLGNVSYARVTLKVEGDKLSGTLNELRLEGEVRGEKVTFKAANPKGDRAGDFSGEKKADVMAGTGEWKGGRKVTWSAKRPVRPPETPQVHDFQPTKFHRVFSDAIPPVLRIFPGDTVRTWTVDAGGVDRQGVARSPGGNPQTGPFYIEGALPGDTLVVKLNRVRLNRDSAGSGTEIVPSALDANYYRETKYKDDYDGTWTLDREAGVARLKNASERLKNYTIKLRPMLGCIGVAPAGHQAFRTGYLGSYGGNLDYNQIQEGTVLYLRVNAPGALLFIGDGHAAEGDGELTGDALETSMDVEFTVKLIKGESFGNPRAENEQYLMSLGIANSMSEALQSATTGLANWLAHDYKLEPNEAALVLGTGIEYNIAEVVDPLVHVVAKIRKDLLIHLK